MSLRIPPNAGAPGLLPWRRRAAEREQAQLHKPASAWVVSRADEVVDGALRALKLLCESGPRMIAAVVAKDSLARIARTAEAGGMLPEGLLLLAGGFAASLAAEAIDTKELVEEPMQGLHNASALLKQMSVSSPDAWLAAVAPALIVLWISIGFCKRLARRAFGPESPDAGSLMLASVSTVVVISGLCLSGAWIMVMASVSGVAHGAMEDSFFYVAMVLGFAGICAPAVLAVAGWRYGQQASRQLGARRQLDTLFWGPGIFILVGVLPAIGYYGGRAAITEAAAHSFNDPAYISWSQVGVSAYEPQCFASGDKLVCQMLVLSKDSQHAYAMTPMRRATFKFLDSHGQHGEALRLGDGEVEQLAPRAEAASLWTLAPRQPTAVVVAVSKARVCDHLRLMAKPPHGLDKNGGFELTLVTGPGYKLATEGHFAMPSLVFVGQTTEQSYINQKMTTVTRLRKTICEIA